MQFILLFLAVFYYFECLSLTNLSKDDLKYEISLYNYLREKRNVIDDLQLKDRNPPKIPFDNPISIKFLDNSYRLECKATGNPTPTIKWFNNSVNNIRYNGFTEIRENDVYITNSGGSLDISPKVSASYFCSATNMFGTVFSRKSEVQKIFHLNDITIAYDTIEINPNEKAVIECITKPDIWIYDFVVKYWEIKINGESSRTISKTEGRFSVINVTKVPQLHIRNVTEDDFRNLQVKCFLENRISPTRTIDSDHWMKLKKLTDIYYSSNFNFDKCKGTEISVAQGQNIELPWCSFPITEKIVWYKSNSSSISNGEMIRLMSSKYSLISERYGNLLIKNVDVSDEGYYFVKKDHKVPQDYSPFHLRVTVKIGLEITPADTYATLGNSVTFRCIVIGYPVTDIFWLHNGVYQKADDPIKSDLKTKVTTLYIGKVTTENAGSYQCVAESKNIVDNRINDCAQQAVSVIIAKMPPRLVSQNPFVPQKDLYATIKIDSFSSVVKMQCSFNSTPRATIQWYLDDQPIVINEITYAEDSYQDPYTVNSVLHIDLQKLRTIADNWKYGGLYTSEATNQHGSSKCKTLVFIEGVLKIRDRGKITLKHDQQATLKCYVISSDVPEITWSKIKDGKNMKFPDTHRETESRDRREIFIKQVSKEDHEASYECNATLGGKTISEVFNISVARPPPGVTPFPEEDILNERSMIEYNCQPLPDLDLPWYSWWEFRSFQAINNKSVIISPRDMKEEAIDGISANWRNTSNLHNDYPELPVGVPTFLIKFPNIFSKLEITFHKKLNMANLTCVIQNNAGIAKRSFRITIGVIEFNVEPPSKKNVILGGSFTIDCSPKQNQLHTTTTWLNKDIPLPLFDSNASNRIYRVLNGTLVVNDINENDPTEFLCMIKSISTEVRISKLVQIYLQVPARIMPLKDTIDLVKKLNYNIVCTVYGDSDKLHIEWQREENGQWKSAQNMNAFPIELPNMKMRNFSLPFPNANDDYAGRYKCVARNSFNKGDVEKIVRISVVAAPGPIYIPHDSVKTEARSSSIEWNEPMQKGNKPILDYLVTWKSEIDFSERNVTDKQIHIEGLRPHQTYNVSIRARNDVGLGEAFSINVKTLEATPDGPVLDLCSFSNSSTNLVLTWKPPDILHQNGKILKYEVCYHIVTTTKLPLYKLPWPKPQNQNVFINDRDNQKSAVNKVTCIFVNITKCLLTDLPKFTDYAFAIRSINNKGVGPFAYIKERTLEDFPEKAPVGVTCTPKATKMNLQWNPPPRDSINGVLKGYRIKYFRPDHYGVETDGLLDNFSKTTLILDNLIPFSNYSIQVAVVNQKGFGPMSAPQICVTQQESPSVPEIVNAFQYNNTCVFVVWTPPLEPNGPLIQYCINVSKADKVICLKANTQQWYFKHIVCGLITHREYVVAVTAHNILPGRPGESAPLIVKSGTDAIVSIPRTVVVTNRATVVLDCETINNDAKPLWSHYLTAFSSEIKIEDQDSNYHIEPNRSLIIKSANKNTNGTYKCALPNTSINYTVSVIAASNGTSHPTEIYYHTSSLTSISISWRSALSLRLDDPIVGFFIVVSHNGGDILNEFKVKPKERSYTISNLTCGTLYQLNLFVSYRVGNKTPAKLNVLTLGTKPLWANSTSLLAAEYPQSLCFRLTSFQPGQGCPPDKFIVTLSPTYTGLSKMDEGPLHFTIEHKNIYQPCNNITGLHPNTDYSYKIEAINNAGFTVNFGYGKTLQAITITPSLEKLHNSGLLHMIDSYKFYIISIAFGIIIIVIIGIVFNCIRRRYIQELQPSQKVTNNLRPVLTQSQLPIATPSSSHRNRRLPAPPCNTYDSGILTTQKIQEEDDDLKPYATYAPIRLPESLSPNTRAKHGKKSLTNDPTAYNAGSQTHSYLYPDMVGSGQQQQPTSSMEIHNNANNIDYNNSPKQPLLKGRTLYSKGYSVGGDIHCPLLSQRPSESICQEPYRPGGSTWSNTTGSSTKELNQVFHQNYSVDMPLGLREQDEDNCSTTRAGTITALPNRMRATEEFNPHESYFESCSSGDDPGIQMFTQERFPGQQAVEPRFTHATPAYIRQISTASSTYSSVDDPLSRNVSASHINPSTSSYLPSRFMPQDTLTEEDEQNNYQNKFVIV